MQSDNKSIQKNYYAIIPANVRYDKKLTANAKLLYGEITALSNASGYCWASDKYFSDLYNVSKASIQSWMKNLEMSGYIVRKVFYKKNSKEIEERRIYLQSANAPIQENLHTYTRKLSDPTQENLHTPIQENFRENNTVFNNTTNNTLNTHPVSNETDSIPYKEILDYLNQKIESKHKYTIKEARELIKARYDEGFTLGDFRKVIDTKVEEWKGTNMERFLWPKTLFGPKFEKYLNQKGVSAYKSNNFYGKYSKKQKKVNVPDWVGKEFDETPDEVEAMKYKKRLERLRKSQGGNTK